MFGLMLLSSGSVSAAEAMQTSTCKYDLFRYRSPVISGCEFHITKEKTTEFYTSNSGTVFTGTPTFSQMLKDKASNTRRNCPHRVVLGIEEMLKEMKLSWQGFKEQMRNEYFLPNHNEIGKISLVNKDGSLSGRFSFLGIYHETFDVQKDSLGFYWTEIQGINTVSFSLSQNSEATVSGDFGALDFRGSCQ